MDPLDHPGEHGVRAVERRLIGHHEEELGTGAVRPAGNLDRGDGAPDVAFVVRLAGEPQQAPGSVGLGCFRVARQRVSALNDPARDDPVERGAVVVALLGLQQEEGGVVRGLLGQDLDDEAPVGGLEDHLLAHHVLDGAVGGEEVLGLRGRSARQAKAQNEDGSRPAEREASRVHAPGCPQEMKGWAVYSRPFVPDPTSITASSGPAAAEMARDISVPVKTRTLGNGLRVLLHEDRRLPVVHVALWYHVGSKNEQPWRTGFAHLFEHLMFEGSRHNNSHFIRLMERAGASLSAGGVNGTTSHDRTNYYETVPREALGLALWAESDRMAYLLDVLDQTKLDTQREVVRNERFQRMDNVPYGTAWEKMFHALFPPGHPYSWDVIGDMAHLAAADLSDVHGFFRTWYAPNNAVLVVAGDYDERRAMELVRRYFGPIPPGRVPGRPSFPPEARASHRRIVVPEAVPHARLYCGWSTVPFFHEDEPALDLLSEILSDGLNSRLYRRMVYEDRTASDVSAFHYSLESGGLTGVVATARPEVPLSRLREQMDEELVRMADEGPTGEELQRVQAATQVAFVGALERLGTKADLLARYATFAGDPRKLAEHWVRYREVTRDDLQRAARKYLLAPRVELLYGDPEAEGEPPVVPAPVGPGDWQAPAASPAPENPRLSPEPDRSRTPRRGRRGHFEPPLPETRELGNGVVLYVLPRRDLPKIVGNIMMPGGKQEEPRELAGLASLTAEMLNRGTKQPDRPRVRGRGRPDRRGHRGAGRHGVRRPSPSRASPSTSIPPSN